VKPSDALAAMELCYEAGVPFHLEGEPGVGKTSLVYQLAAKKKAKVLVTRLADREPSDFQIPMIDQKTKSVHWITPDDFPTVTSAQPMFWFFDEWRQGIPQVQNVAGRLLNERMLGNYKVPDNVYICAASNRAKDRAATNRTPSHIGSRFNWLLVEPHIGDWTTWAIQHGVETEIIAFLKWRSEFLSKFDPNVDVSPTCRAWEKTDNIVKANKKKKVPVPLAVEERVHAGNLGDGVAAELVGFLSIWRNLTDPTVMLMNPDKCDIPTDPATLCAVCGALAKKATTTNMDRVVRLAGRMPAEFSVLLITSAVEQDNALTKTRPFIEWADKNQHVLA